MAYSISLGSPAIRKLEESYVSDVEEYEAENGLFYLYTNMFITSERCTRTVDKNIWNAYWGQLLGVITGGETDSEVMLKILRNVECFYEPQLAVFNNKEESGSVYIGFDEAASEYPLKAKMKVVRISEAEQDAFGYFTMPLFSNSVAEKETVKKKYISGIEFQSWGYAYSDSRVYNDEICKYRGVNFNYLENVHKNKGPERLPLNIIKTYTCNAEELFDVILSKGVENGFDPLDIGYKIYFQDTNLKNPIKAIEEAVLIHHKDDFGKITLIDYSSSIGYSPYEKEACSAKYPCIYTIHFHRRKDLYSYDLDSSYRLTIHVKEVDGESVCEVASISIHESASASSLKPTWTEIF